MFELANHKAKLDSVNARAEIHGEERKPAFDLKFTVAMGNECLAFFAPELRSSLYKKSAAQGELIDEERDSALRFPKMGSFKWDWEGVGYKLTIPYGIGGSSDIVVDGININGFRITPQEGSTVLVTFRAIAHLDEKVVGPLCSLIQRDTEISIDPPPPASAADLFKE
ncbi:hypothetical protein ACKZDW_04150 (plasmid) [Ralstonia syzygii subsp. celebesensis]|uniref:Uncharacterized protein n=1 Tax=blood disease bacterium R229 TaxID=741978 RepID=G2ZXH4_9RALS|nr:hypothetical protein [Ralstonia syzygii]QQV57725.1 hypothetical protein JK151_19965 [Ralstonia syzygii subsp. celebesensis]CCA83753.1 conserved hypothetical protein [blood disease bacterium R229]